MIRYYHQYVTSTGDWWDFEESAPGVFRRVYVKGDIQYDPKEQDTVIEAFTELLRAVTRDGGRKRAAGEKPPWFADDGHTRALYSHLYKWAGRRERVDPDSGAHPLVHLAWRALAIAYRETVGSVDPALRKTCEHPLITPERRAASCNTLVCPDCSTEFQAPLAKCERCGKETFEAKVVGGLCDHCKDAE